MLQVLTNLIGNAVKFTSPTGAIRISAQAAERAVVITVSDDGPGIAREHLSRVFDRFYQVRPGDPRGAGLGLAICKGIIDAHGGRIWIESEAGQGTSVRFTLPVA